MARRVSDRAVRMHSLDLALKAMGGSRLSGTEVDDLLEYARDFRDFVEGRHEPKHDPDAQPEGYEAAMRIILGAGYEELEGQRCKMVRLLIGAAQAVANCDCEGLPETIDLRPWKESRNG